MALFYLLVDAYVNKIKNINIYGDSKLAIESSSGRMRVSHPNIVEYSEAVNKMLRLFSYKKLEFI
jgi:ribonuclease HI